MKVLREERGWLAVDKPAGVVVVPARDEDPGASLWRLLEAARGERLWVVHRIDRETSGVVLFARDPEVHRSLSMVFEQGRAEKEYLAFTRGVPSVREVRAPLAEGRKGRMRVAAPGEAGKAARTGFAVSRRWDRSPPIALVRCTPFTGRQHQLRVHLQSVGTPILCDPLYGEPAPDGLPLARLALHAARLRVPVDGVEEDIASPLPADLLALQRALDEGTPDGR